MPNNSYRFNMRIIKRVGTVLALGAADVEWSPGRSLRRGEVTLTSAQFWMSGFVRRPNAGGRDVDATGEPNC